MARKHIQTHTKKTPDKTLLHDSQIPRPEDGYSASICIYRTIKSSKLTPVDLIFLPIERPTAALTPLGLIFNYEVYYIAIYH